MSTIRADDYIKISHAHSADETISTDQRAKDSDAYYIFDSKKAAELKRLDEQHYAFVDMAKGRLVHSPVKHPKRILDIGCGTGITTVTLGRMFPEAEVVGLDMNIVPSIHEKPENVTYIQARIEDVIRSVNQPSQDLHLNKPHSNETLRRGTYDYIFVRFLVLAIFDWPIFVSTCASLLAPGGWLEMHEGASFELYSAASPTLPLNTMPSYTWDWTNTMCAEAKNKGYELLIGKH